MTPHETLKAPRRSSALPTTVEEFKRRKKPFADWLIANGSQVMPATNPFEIARFTTPGGTGLIHRNNADRITSWQGGAREAFHAFLAASPWRADGKAKPRRKSKSDHLVLAIIARDGNDCLYCGVVLAPEAATLEHIVSVTHQGPNHIANLALSCRPCNAAMGHLDAAQKFRRALALRCTAP